MRALVEFTLAFEVEDLTRLGGDEIGFRFYEVARTLCCYAPVESPRRGLWGRLLGRWRPPPAAS